ncbi:hypothetical protein NXS19_000586 [Fusarium pseudograminearum]|nr:hypothetical protein NXS19_000586 [Fusarium pseudograminearum]
MIPSWQVAAVLLLAGPSLADNFTIYNGQIFTPGFVVLDAPQPYTPLGGDTLHVAIDVTANGKLPLPSNDNDNDNNDDNQIFSIEMFLYSYVTGRNFTISNRTASANNASLGEIMAQEPGSTVKHVNWVWPIALLEMARQKETVIAEFTIFQSAKTLDTTATITTPYSMSPSLSTILFQRVTIDRRAMSCRMRFFHLKISMSKQLMRWAFCLRLAMRLNLI